MPSIEIVGPALGEAEGAALLLAVQEAFGKSTPFGAEITLVQFVAIPPAACTRPFYHVKVFCPRVARRTKAALVGAISQVVAGIVSGGPEGVLVHIAEHPYDNVGVEGKLLSDLYPELREIPWYHPMEPGDLHEVGP